jgi:hypothetical protein
VGRLYQQSDPVVLQESFFWFFFVCPERWMLYFVDLPVRSAVPSTLDSGGVAKL